MTALQCACGNRKARHANRCRDCYAATQRVDTAARMAAALAAITPEVAARRAQTHRLNIAFGTRDVDRCEAPGCGATLTDENVRSARFCSVKCAARAKRAAFRAQGLRSDGRPYKRGPRPYPQHKKIDLPPPVRRGPPRAPLPDGPEGERLDRKREQARADRRQEYHRLKNDPIRAEDHRRKAREGMRRLYAARREAGLTVKGEPRKHPAKEATDA